MIDQIRQAKSELAEICRRHNVRRLDLFGSAVGANFDPPTSDLDFLVEFGPFTKGEYSEHYFASIERSEVAIWPPGRPARFARRPQSLLTGEHQPDARVTVCRVMLANICSILPRR